jgi:hypothetical protein
MMSPIGKRVLGMSENTSQFAAKIVPFKHLALLVKHSNDRLERTYYTGWVRTTTQDKEVAYGLNRNRASVRSSSRMVEKDSKPSVVSRFFGYTSLLSHVGLNPSRHLHLLA